MSGVWLSEVRLPGGTGAALAMLTAVVLASASPATAAPARTTPSALPSASGELDAVRQDCIATARQAQQHEQAITTPERTISLLGRDAEGRQRALEERRPDRARLLGPPAHRARDPPEGPPYAPAAAIDRIRGEMLLQGTLPGL